MLPNLTQQPLTCVPHTGAQAGKECPHPGDLLVFVVRLIIFEHHQMHGFVFVDHKKISIHLGLRGSYVIGVCCLPKDLPICFLYWSTGNALALASFLPILLACLRRNKRRKKTNRLSQGCTSSFSHTESHRDTPASAVLLLRGKAWNLQEGGLSWHTTTYSEVGFHQADGFSLTYICYT